MQLLFLHVQILITMGVYTWYYIEEKINKYLSDKHWMFNKVTCNI